MQRHRPAPHTFDDRIAAEKVRLEAKVARLRDGPKKDELLEKIRQLETTSHMYEWLSSPDYNRRNRIECYSKYAVGNPFFCLRLAPSSTVGNYR